MVIRLESEEQAREWLKNRFHELVSELDNSKSLDEKKKILQDFDFREIDAEEQSSPFGFGKIMDLEKYKKVRKLLKDFFEWIEINQKINASLEVYLNTFFTENQSSKLLLLANKIKKMLNQTPLEQIDMMLNSYKSVYELNLRMLIIILEESLKKNNMKITDNLGLKEFKSTFKEYPKINKLRGFFKEYLRDPIAHENWLYEKDEIIFLYKDKKIRKNPVEMVQEFGDLMFFKIAFQSCAIEQYKQLLHSPCITEAQINKLHENFRLTLNRLTT